MSEVTSSAAQGVLQFVVLQLINVVHIVDATSRYQPAAGLQIWVFRTYMAVASVGTVFAAGYLLWMLQRVAFGVVKTEFEDTHVHDVHLPEWVAWLPLLLLIVALGVYPHLLFRITDGAVHAVTHGVAALAPGGAAAGP